MKLPREFIRLPFSFDAARLRAEIEAVPESAWKPHPQGFVGNDALLLVSAHGDPRDDALIGDMQATPVLQSMPYLRQVMAHFGSPIGRSRLMRISDHEEVQAHSDVHYYWRDHLRIHIPVQTDPGVRFTCGDESLHMVEGECWIFDTWRIHRVENPSSHQRIHVVLDTRGSWALWSLIRRAIEGELPVAALAFDPGLDVRPAVEGPSAPVVMSPTELGEHIEFLLRDLRESRAAPEPRLEQLDGALAALRQHWQARWRQFGATETGWPHFRALMQQVEQRLRMMPGQLRASDGTTVAELVRRWMLEPALNPDFADAGHRVSLGPRPALERLQFDRPVFIVAAPRSGSTLLFETLARAPGLWTIGGESHEVFEGIDALSPAHRGFESNALDPEQASPEVIAELRRRFGERLRDRQGRGWRPEEGPVTMLEKTPKNALRVAFLARAFPDARFIYLAREPFANASSILEAWRSGAFVTYPKLPDWNGGPWSLLLTPGWRQLEGRPLADVAAAQYVAANAAILDALQALPSGRWMAVDHDELVNDPMSVMERLAGFIGFEWDRPPPQALPRSMVTLTRPGGDKWLVNAALLAPQAEALTGIRKRIAEATGVDLADRSADAAATVAAAPPGGADAAATHARAGVDVLSGATSVDAVLGAIPQQLRPLASVHSASFAEVLKRAGASLMISTYQAGKLVLARIEDGRVNTAFRNLPKPMGIAVQGPHVAIGIAQDVLFLQQGPLDVAAPCSDARFLPRRSHSTGNIDIHEMAWVGDELWVVNTRFCCLATLADDASFVPRWMPPFLTALAPEDRCHLNGLAVVDGRVRYVSMLAETDTPAGWREHKADGGLIYDVVEERVVCRGLSMPHSPRWYEGQLYVLESGNGGLCRVDPKTGARETLIELPGFTRGMDFLGPLAFVGLSQVRESATFARLPLTERLSARNCGVWVVNLNRRELVGFLRFEDAVQEIFSVNVLPGLRHPDVCLPGDPASSNAFVLPDDALAAVPAGLRRNSAA